MSLRGGGEGVACCCGSISDREGAEGILVPGLASHGLDLGESNSGLYT